MLDERLLGHKGAETLKGILKNYPLNFLFKSIEDDLAYPEEDEIYDELIAIGFSGNEELNYFYAAVYVENSRTDRDSWTVKSFLDFIRNYKSLYRYYGSTSSDDIAIMKLAEAGISSYDIAKKTVRCMSSSALYLEDYWNIHLTDYGFIERLDELNEAYKKADLIGVAIKDKLNGKGIKLSDRDVRSLRKDIAKVLLYD